MIAQQIYDFFNTWFWQPVLQDAAYNIVDTTVYAIIFVAAAWLLYKYFFVKFKIKIDRNFMLALGGWIATGASLRVIEDVALLEVWWLRSPFIYLLMFAAAFSTLLAARWLEKKKIKPPYFLRIRRAIKIPYWKTWGAIGWAFAAVNIALLPLSNWQGLFIVGGIFFAWLGLFVFLRVLVYPKSLKSLKKLFTGWNITTIQAHMLDASASFTAVAFFGFWEKHVLAGGLAAAFGPWTLFPMKLAVLIPAVWLIDRWCEKDLEKRYLKMIIIILGFALGLRNALALGALG